MVRQGLDLQAGVAVQPEIGVAVELYLKPCGLRRDELVALDDRQVVVRLFPFESVATADLSVAFELADTCDAGRDLGLVVAALRVILGVNAGCEQHQRCRH